METPAQVVAEFAHISVESAEKFLHAAGDDIETAIALAMAEDRSERGQRESERMHFSSSSPRPPAPSAAELIEARESLIRPGNRSSKFSSILGFLYRAMNSCLSGTLHALSIFIFGRAKISINERARSLFPEINSTVSEGSFAEAVNIAKQRGGMLVGAVYGEETRDFTITEIFGDGFINRLNRKIWVFDVDSREGREVYRSIGGRRLPVFFLLKISSKTELVYKNDGGIGGLLKSVEFLENEKMQIEENRKLREKQDFEFAETLENDKKKEFEKQQIIKESLDKERDIIKMNETIQNPKKTALEIIQEIDLFDKNHETLISVRLPDGSRIQKKFHAQKCSTKHLYAWVTASSLLPELAHKKDLLDPLWDDNYFLSTSFPNKRLLPEDSTSLHDHGLFPNAVLSLTSIDN